MHVDPSRTSTHETSEGCILPRRDTYAPDQEIVDLVDKLCPQNYSQNHRIELAYRLSSEMRSCQRPLRIGIYEGAFDPPHRGHEETARAAIGLANLDLLVVTCYSSTHPLKPDISPHAVRLQMTSTYFRDDPRTVISPLQRNALERLFAGQLTVGIIGSDTFNRFLRAGVAHDFNTTSIFVAERRNAPLESAPATLEGRPVLYLGSTQLAFNGSSSTEIRRSLATSDLAVCSTMLNDQTAKIARATRIYDNRRPQIDSAPHHPRVEGTLITHPERYRSCVMVPHKGLTNGLLSESFLHRVVGPSGETIAFRKTLPPHREPLLNLSDEVIALERFNQLGIKAARSPVAQLENDPVSLWIERAPGETIADLLTGYERGERTLTEACEALSALGTALRSLHDQTARPFSARAMRLFEKHVEETNVLLARCSPWQLDEPACKEAIGAFQLSADALRQTEIRCSLVHGDANCGNFLWDASQRTVWAIDLQRCGTQLRTDAPDFPSFDYHSLIHSLHYYPNIGFRGRRGGEYALLDALKSGYGDIPPEEDQFFQARWTLQRLLGRSLRVLPPRG